MPRFFVFQGKNDSLEHGNNMTHESTGVPALIGIISTIIGISLIIGMVYKDKNAEKQNLDHYGIANAQITNISIGDYRCYTKDACSQCAQGYGFPTCQSMIYNKQVGSCQDTISKCCQQSCFDCTWYDDHETCNFCGIATFYCYERCYCSNLNSNPLCTVIDGTCFNPRIYVQFIVDDGINISTNANIHCGMGNTKCANEFIEGKSVGDNIDVYYEKSNPLIIFIDDLSYKKSAGVIVGFVFGSIFLTIGVVCLGITVLSIL